MVVSRTACVAHMTTSALPDWEYAVGLVQGSFAGCDDLCIDIADSGKTYSALGVVPSCWQMAAME